MEAALEPTVSLSLTVKDSAAALDFYSRALGARELFRMPGKEGGVLHAEFLVGNTRIFMSDEDDAWHARAMPDGASASCLFSILTDNCDAAHARAVQAGATPLIEPTDHFWGIRSSIIRDPFGYRWSLAQVIENLSPEEIARRAAEFAG